ncbi:MAG: hypothetical protein J6Y90_05445, partial [Lachnospiraceae bacterium]|nr:hypothetical protein [Lachnospiraceae bacterium]
MKNKSVVTGLLTFVITLVFTTIIAIIYLTTTAQARREKAQSMVNAKAQTIETAIANREYITRILEIDISGNKGSISNEQFQIIAEELFDDNFDVVDITLAPDGMLSYMYPIDSGITEKFNLFEDGARGIYADYSKMSGVPVIIAPTELSDGETGIIICRPIYTDYTVSEDSFWGFASVTLNLSKFLSAVELSSLHEAGYEYKLMGNSLITGEDSMIAEDREKDQSAPVSAMVSTVGGGYWTLFLSPKGNWMNPIEILGSMAIAIIISTLAGIAMANFVSMRANAKELEILSYRDSLTNLYNPRSYQEHMEELS